MWITWDRALPQIAEDMVFLACGLWTLAEEIPLLGQGLLGAWLGLSPRQVTQCGAVCVCQCAHVCREGIARVGQEGRWTSRIRGICDRMGLHIHCASRTVLEAQLFLSLRISGSSALTRYIPTGIAKLLLEFIFKLFWSFNNLMAPRILKWILSRSSDSNYSIFKWFQLIFKCSSADFFFFNFINTFI